MLKWLFISTEHLCFSPLLLKCWTESRRPTLECILDKPYAADLCCVLEMHHAVCASARGRPPCFSPAGERVVALSYQHMVVFRPGRGVCVCWEWSGSSLCSSSTLISTFRKCAHVFPHGHDVQHGCIHNVFISALTELFQWKQWRLVAMWNGVRSWELWVIQEVFLLSAEKDFSELGDSVKQTSIYYLFLYWQLWLGYLMIKICLVVEKETVKMNESWNFDSGA